MKFQDLHGPTARFLILSPVVCAIVVAAAGWFYYQRQRETIDNAALNQLSAIANFKTEQIANWRQERIGNGRVLAVSTLTASAQRLLSERQPRKADVAEITGMMGTLSQEFSYTDGMLVDLDGSVRIRLRQEHSINDESRRPLYRELSQKAVTLGDVVLSDLTLTPPAGRPLMMLTVPVRDLGALILEIDPEIFLYPYLRSWPTPTRSAESLLIRHDGNTALALSPPRALPGAELVASRPWSPEIPDEDQLSKGWFRRNRDYRGVQILGVTKRVPGSPWYLSVKIDQTEAESPLRPLVWELAAIGALIVIANAAGVGLVWRSRQLHELRERESWLQQFSRQLRALAERLQRVREEERTRVAREIHDELGQALTVIKIDLSLLMRGLSRDQGQQFERILKEVDETIELVRRISTELRPSILDAVGLVAAIEWAAGEFESRLGTKCRLNLPQDEMVIDPERATALFRIFQETLTNVARHAEATEVNVRLAREDTMLILEIYDNGKGIGEQQVSAGRSLGILGMRERALLLGGELSIRGASGEGTTVKVRLPQTHSRQAGEAM